jgi:hypothetical protein
MSPITPRRNSFAINNVAENESDGSSTVSDLASVGANAVDASLLAWTLMLATSCMTVITDKSIVHPGSACFSCGMTPIVGVRFRCVNCVNYDLCAECYDEEHEQIHNPYHLFLKIPRPLPLDPSTSPINIANTANLLSSPAQRLSRPTPLLPVLYPKAQMPSVQPAAAAAITSATTASTATSSSKATIGASHATTKSHHSAATIVGTAIGDSEDDEDDKGKQHTSVHADVTCDGCGRSPIAGIRYKCVNCDEFNFCEDCEVCVG